jgi:AAA15 family ATPase/GTPase
VGKSNVLEALGLSNILLLDTSESLKKMIRVENKNELFYDLSEKICSVKTNLETIEFNSLKFDTLRHFFLTYPLILVGFSRIGQKSVVSRF